MTFSEPVRYAAPTNPTPWSQPFTVEEFTIAIFTLERLYWRMFNAQDPHMERVKAAIGSALEEIATPSALYYRDSELVNRNKCSLNVGPYLSTVYQLVHGHDPRKLR
jgi:hypothetical protein